MSDFRITTPELADWALRKLAHAEQQVAAINRALDDRIARLKDAAAAQQREHVDTIDTMRALLADYGYRQVAAQAQTAPGVVPDAKRWKALTKTWRMPSGYVQVQRRDATARPACSPTDPAVYEWAQRYAPEHLRPRVVLGDMCKSLEVRDGKVYVRIAVEDGEVIYEEVPETIAVAAEPELHPIVSPAKDLPELPAWLEDDDELPAVADLVDAWRKAQGDSF